MHLYPAANLSLQLKHSPYVLLFCNSFHDSCLMGVDGALCALVNDVLVKEVNGGLVFVVGRLNCH